MATNWITSGVRRAAWVGVAFVIVMIPTLMWLAKRPPTTDCGDHSWLHPNGHVVVFASQIIIKPWYGRHNVYGVFVIPPEYRDKEYSGTVIVRGVKEQEDLSARPTEQHGVVIAGVPDRFVKHAHIRSRVALWFLLTGRFGDIRSTCNWALVLTEKKPGMN